jgi:Putative arginyl-tRNA:protein arginylyltransferase
MSRDISPDLRYLRLYFTRPHKCSYLPEREAVTSFVDPSLDISQKLYSQLSRLGFRRSGKFFLRPQLWQLSGLYRLPGRDLRI